MKKARLTKILSFVLAGYLVLVIVFLHPILGRIDILSDYNRLLSDPDALKRLESEPSLKKWGSLNDDDTVSLGYASFSFPFGEILTITQEYSHVIIESVPVRINLSCSVLADYPVDKEHPETFLYALTYKGGDIKAREEKYQKYDMALWKLERNTPMYEFHKKILMQKPKSIASICLMNFDDLYIYEKFLEMKNADLWTGEKYLFETDKLNGSVQELDFTEKQDDYTSCYMISIWDLDNKVFQLVQVVSYFDKIKEEDIRRFVSSFSFNMDVIESNAEDLKPVILKTLEKNEKYVPTMDNDKF